MAFRHFGGSVPPVRVAWTCPTCGDKQMGPLEAGCTKCQAGADAKKAAAGVSSPVELAYHAWVAEDIPFDHIADPQQLLKAFMAGAAWQRSQAAPAGNGLTEAAGGNVHSGAATLGGYLLAMVSPDSHESTLTDQRTHVTILAALAFYRDNQLAYGGLPGQLSKAEVDDLITKLTPQESEQ